MSSGVTYQHMQEHGPFYNDAYSHIPRMLTFNPPIHIKIIFFLVEQPPDQTGIYYNLPFLSENHSIQKTTTKKNWYAEDYISMVPEHAYHLKVVFPARQDQPYCRARSQLVLINAQHAARPRGHGSPPEIIRGNVPRLVVL